VKVTTTTKVLCEKKIVLNKAAETWLVTNELAPKSDAIRSLKNIEKLSKR
jgi:hypothetical protein